MAVIPSWPSALPVAPLLAAYDEKIPSLLSNVTTGNKSMIIRKIASRAQTKISVSFNFNKEELEIFEVFFNEILDGGARRFTFTHPRKKTEVDVSFSPVQQTAYTITPNGSMTYFKVNTELMIWK